MPDMIVIKRNGIEDIDSFGYKEFFTMVDNFPFDGDYGDACKVKNMAEMLNKAYRRTREELKGVFTLNEAYAIAHTFNGHLYTSLLSSKVMLLSNLEDAINYENIDDMFEFDKTRLVTKIESLTEFQAFTVIRMAYMLLNLDGNICDEEFSRIFMI